MVSIGLVAAILCFANILAADTGGTLNNSDWLTEESNSFIVYYRQSADLKALERMLSVKQLPSGRSSAYSEINPPKEICDRLESLFSEVKAVLGMNPAIQKVKIKIFKDTDELNEAYLVLFGNKGDYKSFYINASNTIYTAENSMTDSVMVHEMAHVVIDHYFSVIPPEIISEMIASYVDAHFAK